jgi:transcriptional regulator with XRE-family HTH domain
MTVDRAVEVLKESLTYLPEHKERDEAIALAIKGLLVLRSANSLFVGSDALVGKREKQIEETLPIIIVPDEYFFRRMQSCIVRKNLSLSDISVKLGVDTAKAMRYVEGGFNCLDCEFDIQKMAGILGESPSWLLTGEEGIDSEFIFVINKDFSKRFAAARITKKLTTREVADRLGLDPMALTHIETTGFSGSHIRIDALKLADILECDARWLLYGESGGEE